MDGPIVVCILFFFFVLILSEFVNTIENERMEAQTIVPEPWTVYKNKGSEEE
jgi:hypothetical protein